MKNIEDLMRTQKEDQNPGQHIGKFLLEHTNSPGYLDCQREANHTAAKRDLEAEMGRFRNLRVNNEDQR